MRIRHRYCCGWSRLSARPCRIVRSVDTARRSRPLRSEWVGTARGPSLGSWRLSTVTPTCSAHPRLAHRALQWGWQSCNSPRGSIDRTLSLLARTLQCLPSRRIQFALLSPTGRGPATEGSVGGRGSRHGGHAWHRNGVDGRPRRSSAKGQRKQSKWKPL